jgi:hypothetical protein
MPTQQQLAAQFVQAYPAQYMLNPQSALLLQNSGAPLTLIPGNGMPVSR